MEIYIDKKKMVQLLSILYIVTIAILLWDRTDFMIMGSVFRKIKYLYLLLATIYFLFDFDGKISRKISILLAVLLLHTILFGRVFVNPIVIDDTNYHFREMMIFIYMVFITYYFVWSADLFDRFVRWNYYVLAGVMLGCGIIRPGNFVNPLYFIYVFSGNHAYRSEFGFGHANFTGNLCVFALMYSVFILEEMVTRRKNDAKVRRELQSIILLDLYIGEVLFSTQSRTSILAGILFLGVYLLAKMLNGRRISAEWIILAFFIVLALVFVILSSDFLSSVWSESNRQENITINMPFFRLYNPWIGMGYIPSSGFLLKSYGYNTFALDIFYLYIFFTTGYLGCIIMSVFLVLTMYFLVRTKNKRYKICSIALFCAMLIAGLGQTHVVSYSLHSSMFNWIILFLGMTPKKSCL